MKSWRSFPPLSLVLLAFIAALALSGAIGAQEPKEPSSYLDQKEFFKPELYISSSHVAVDDVLDQLPNRLIWERYLVPPVALKKPSNSSKPC